MSLAPSTRPPFSIAARSTSRPRSRVEVDGHLAPQPQPRDAAVREDVEPHVRERALAFQPQGVARSRREPRRWEHQRPGRDLECRAGRRAAMVARLERGLLRLIADEVARVHVRHVEPAAQTELQHAPVVAGRSTPPRLPAIHPLAAIRVLAGDEDGRLWLDETASRSEELVASRRARARRRAPKRGRAAQACPSVTESSAPAGAPSKDPSEKIGRPRSQVRRTTPKSERPR